MITVTMFLRPSCPECDQAQADLETLQSILPHRLVVVDVDNDPVLRNAYQDRPVPVVQIGPYKLQPPFTRQDLQVALSAAQQRAQHLEETGDSAYANRVQRGQTISGADRVSFWLSEHYMVLFNVALLFYVGLPFLAPAFMKIGATFPARVIYTIYSPLCHQLAFRSFFLYGEQAYYPRELAKIPGEITYEQATGQSGADFATARAFDGNPMLGYKVALCERDVAIYGSLLLFGLIFSLTGKRIKSLPWYLWVFLGVVPIALDGGSQLATAFSWLASWLPARESTPVLRVLTGSLFGISTAWYLYPFIEDSMRETRAILARKFAVSANSNPLEKR